MNAKSLIAAAAIVALAPAAFAQSTAAQIAADLKNPAVAADYGRDSDLYAPNTASNTTRAEVMAATAKARSQGALPVEANMPAVKVPASDLTRAQAHTEALRYTAAAPSLNGLYAGS